MISFIKNTLRSSFAVGSLALTGEERRFCESWVDRHFSDQNEALLVLSALINTSLGVIACFVIQFNSMVLAAAHMAAGLYLLLLIVLRHKVDLRRGAPVLYLPVQWGLVGVWSWNVHDAVQRGDSVQMALAPLTLVLACVVMGQTNGKLLWMRVTYLIYVLIGVAGWGAHPGVGRFAFLLCLTIFTRYLYDASRIHQLRKEAVTELRARELLAQNERLRHEHDMALARGLQESFVVDDATAAGGGHDLTVTSFHSYFGALGGDWSAHRRLPGGDVVAMVMDATGKGIQAALVVHAVQSLWAEARLDQGFDPERWLRRVNDTLVLMGRRNPHTLTLGLVVAGPRGGVYWSAGHLPLMIAAQRSGEVRQLAASGGLLGFETPLDLRPVSFAFAPDESYAVYLCSDGVIDSQTSRRSKDLAPLLAGLSTGGAEALGAIDIADDKLVTIIEVPAAA